MITCSSDAFENGKLWNAKSSAEETMDFQKTFPVVMKGLYGKGDFHGKNRFSHLKPNFGVFDSFQFFVPAAVNGVVKELGVEPPSMFDFIPTSAGACYNHLSEDGYLDTLTKKAHSLAAEGTELLEAHAAVGHGMDGRVVKIPGMDSMYDYEFNPQEASFPMPAPLLMMISGIRPAVLHPVTTGMILPSVEELEEESHAGLAKEIGKPLYQCGLQVPQRLWKGIHPPRPCENSEDERVLKFLDCMQATFGKRSVAYVSFGSAFFPIARPELAVWLLESLIENNVPLLFAHATEFAPIPQNVLDKIKDAPNACSVKFAPQWQVLDHPATRFFVSHSGSNSCGEAMLAGVPIVSMPFGADQAEYSWLLAHHGVGIQLRQVSTFGKKEWTKCYDGTEIIGTEQAIKEEMKDVWEEMLGRKGDEMRKKMLELRAVVKKSHDEGKSRTAMESLAAYW